MELLPMPRGIEEFIRDVTFEKYKRFQLYFNVNEFSWRNL